MAGKLITLEEAANLLGVTQAEVGDLRQRQELYGYRDGGSWKFKQEDVERLAAERSGGGSVAGGSSPGLSGLDLPVDLGDSEQVVLSEFELGDSGPGSSTVIGGKSKKPDSDLHLTTGSDLNLSSGLSDLSLPGGSDVKQPAAGGSDLNLSSGTSDLNLLGDSGLTLDDSSVTKKSPPKPDNDDDLVLGGDSGLGIMGSDVRLAGDSNVLSGPTPSGIGGSMSAGKTMLTAELADKPAPSSINMKIRDEESVFGDSGSDVTRNVGGSGINLLSPQDSGMLLDDLDLSGASGLAQSIGDESDIKADDDFLLTPSMDLGDDSTDSGSQVIALDGDFGGDDATATLLAGEVPGLSDALGGDFGGGGYGGAPAMAGGYGTVPDTHFGVGSIAALTVCAVLMAVTGIMMYDIIRNMWSWDSPMSINSTLMDMIPGVRK
ncbi:MAG: helix-turn-helix domain-containing protein [Planctomycetaceae bacterium]|nr:helix-turn-helix domain-containing protein [Planctomycetaceae bacterium]